MRLALALLAALATACSDDASSRPHVVLVVADTLRADRLTSQGGPEGLTPRLDEFATEAVRFAAASAHAPWTLPSIASLLTSLHPLEHGAGGRVPEFTRLDDDATTLAGVLARRGYTTHAIANVTFLDPETFGVTREFATVDLDARESNLEVRAATATTDLALGWIDRHRDRAPDAPFFLLVHYFDPHAVYAPPRTFREAWAAEQDRATDWTFGTREQMVALRSGRLDPPRGDILRASRLYDGEVAYLDSEVGRLLDGLAARELDDETVVVFTADHGEEFLDHGGFEHGHTLYEELVHVPLLIRAPGLAPGVVPSRVRHIDVAPTVLELADVPPPDTFVGRSLLPLTRAEEAGDRPSLAHGNFWGPPLSSWTEDGWKLILDDAGEPQLFDLRADPREAREAAATEPGRAAAMGARLEDVRRAMSLLDRGGRASLTPAQRADLAGLGYGGAAPVPDPDR